MFFQHSPRCEIENAFTMPWCWSHFLEGTDQQPKGPDLFVPQITSLSHPICWPHNTWQLGCIFPFQFTRLVAFNLMDWRYLEAFYRVLFTISDSYPSYFQYMISVLSCQTGWETRCVSQLFAATTLGVAFGASGGHWPDRCCDLVWSWPPPGHASSWTGGFVDESSTSCRFYIKFKDPFYGSFFEGHPDIFKFFHAPGNHLWPGVTHGYLPCPFALLFFRLGGEVRLRAVELRNSRTRGAAVGKPGRSSSVCCWIHPYVLCVNLCQLVKSGVSSSQQQLGTYLNES